MPIVVAAVAAVVEGAGLGFGAVSLAAGATAGFSAGAIAIGEFVTYTALSAGLSLASSALQRSLTPDAPGFTGGDVLSQVNAPGVKASQKQAVPMQRICYGAQRSGGPLVFYKAKPPKLYVHHIYSRRKMSRLQAVNINGNRLTFSSTPFDQILVPQAIDGQPNYPGRLRCCFQAGTLDQPINPLLAAAFPDLADEGVAGEWRLPGVTNGVFEYDYGEDWDGEVDGHVTLWGNVQIPNAEIEAEWAPVYDPRVPSCFLPSDPNDVEEWFAAQESWVYSNNAALIAADYLWQPDAMNVGPAGIRWDKVAEAADRADEAAATRDTADTGIYERRYTAGGVIAMDQQPAAIFDSILTASRGSLIQGNDGTCWVSHDGPKQPVFTITDDMLVGQVVYRSFKGVRDLANTVTMRLVIPDRDYQLSDGRTIVRSDLVAEDGAPHELSVSLPFTSSTSTAQRIAKADLSEARIERSWTGGIDLRGLGLREDDCVLIASKICPHWNGLYVVDKWGLTLSLSDQSALPLSLIGYDPTISNDFDPTVDDQQFDLTDTDELLAA